MAAAYSKKETIMKSILRKPVTLTTFAVVALSAPFVPAAVACGSSAPPMATRALPAGLMPRLMEYPSVSPQDPPERAADPSITGLWKTTLVSGGAVVMVSFDTWHSDGTELALDGLFPPATGNVCPGVWEKIGMRTYSTVHPAFEYDPTGTTIVAIFIEREQITLSPDGDSFQGTFTWDSYDFQGKLLPGSVAGTVKGTRINVGSDFPFPFPL